MLAESSCIFQSSMLNGAADVEPPTSHTEGNAQSQVGFHTVSSSLTSISIDHRFSSATVYSGRGAPSCPMSDAPGHMMWESPGSVEEQPLTREQRQQWLETKITVVLKETPTIMLYTHQDEVVPNDRVISLEQVVQRNKAYAELVESKRVDEGTRFQVKGCWTFLPPKKSIHSSVQPPSQKNSGALQVTPWMLRDEFAAFADNDINDEDHEAAGDEEEEEMELLEDPGDSAKDVASERTTETSSTSSAQHSVAWMFSDTIMSTLRIMERAVVQNTMEEKQLSYRGITMDPEAFRVKRVIAEAAGDKQDSEDLDCTMPAENNGAEQENDQEANDDEDKANAVPLKANVPSVRLPADVKALWTFRSPLTRNRQVACMTWNCKETDILAVGYSTLCEDEGQALDNSHVFKGGIVCCWSLKNPLAPERVIQLSNEAGVSSIAFSDEHPSLLAVGNTEGRIVIYDIKKDTNIPAIKTTMTSGQHTAPVWELKWVSRHKERGEFLLSISGDGRVVQWAVGKTIERVAPDLMTLKRHHGAAVESAFAAGTNNNVNPRRDNGSYTKGQLPKRRFEALFSRQCGGMCFDVSPADGSVYVVGTEDGYVHQCNKSQTENYELDYAPHSELVYRVRWSPYSDNYFLTCSADWSSRLYRLGQSAQLLTFDSPNQDAVQDVAWSFTNSTTFATVSAQGSVEFWSVADSIHPTSRVQYSDRRRLSSVLFAEQDAPVVVVGDEKGDVTVFRLIGQAYSNMNLSVEEQEHELEEVIRRATT
uniref:Dynein axonemal intermediate chain 4 n=1 Tax=Trypanosoma congolense (strain IL3000) TaxID=1068625 RepID=G0UJD2_TRYCI|nr:unnamed protein product [Trypanosoma congolense IL3000]